MDPADSPQSNLAKKRNNLTSTEFPEDTPIWAKTLFQSLFSRFDSFTDDINDSVNHAVAIADEANSKANCNAVALKKVEERIDVINNQMVAMQIENRDLRAKVNTLETYQRKDNLLFHGIDEKRNETSSDCAQEVRRILHKLDPDDTKGLQNTKIIRCHRKGPYTAGQTRPIIAKFFGHDRDTIWANISMLKGSSVYLGEDFPLEVEQRRRVLLPVFFKAKNTAAYQGKVMLRNDKLIINKVSYTADDLHKLPQDLNPASLATRQNEEVLVFQGAISPLSNAYQCKFSEDGIVFSNVDQYVQYHKALMAHDDVTATRILATKNVGDLRRMGKSVVGGPTWPIVKIEKIREGIALKFVQNKTLSKYLVDSGERIIGEANGFDKNLGTGIKLTHDNTLNTNLWIGENKMGRMLMDLRERMKSALPLP